MERLKCIVLFLVLFFAVTATAAETKSPKVLLQEALYAEEMEGDIDKAIGIYQKVIEKAVEAERTAAQANYRLGMCYLKKGNKEKAAEYFQQVTSNYPSQTVIVEKAKKRLEKFRPPDEKIIEQAVTTISTCAEGDPRVAEALESIKGIDEEVIVTELVKFLDSETATVRRSAMYILWKGSLNDISKAVPQLQALCSHEEYFTRGMAAIALGAAKINSSFDTLCKMALEDSNGYARRCAAYALGVMGREDAIPILMKATKDSDPFVSANAEWALQQLGSSVKEFPEIVGQWQSVDFVSSPDQFQPGIQQWKGELFLKEIIFDSDGSSSKPWRWTDGWIHEIDGDAKAQYYIKRIDGEKYLFFPWLSGDVTIRGQKPKYYVLKHVERVQLEKAEIKHTFGPITQKTINDDGVGEDFMFDLDTGKSFSVSDAKKWSEKSGAGQEKSLEALIMKSGVDLFGETSKKSLMGIDMIAIPVHNERWNMSPEDVVEQLLLGEPGTPVAMSAAGELPNTFVFKTGQGGMGILQIIEMQDGKAPRHFKIRYKMLQKEVVCREIFVPDADTRDTGVVLDLASGKLLPAGQGDQQLIGIFDKLGKGDLAYDRVLICLRGAKAYQIVTDIRGDHLVKFKNMEQIKDATAYELQVGRIPGRYLFTTGEGNDYEINIISADKNGLKLQYKKAEGLDLAKKRFYSRSMLQNFGRAWIIYLAEHEGKLPNTITEMKRYLIGELDSEKDFQYFQDNVEYVAKKLERADNPWNIIAYDKKTLEEVKYTNILFKDGHVEFYTCDELADCPYEELRQLCNKENRLKVESLRSEGWQLWGQRKLIEAEKKFKEAIELDSTNDNAYQGLGWAQLNQGKKLNAKDSFEKCIKLNPKNSAALNGLGWIAHGQGNIDEAIQWWEKAVEANPYATASLSGLTQVYMERKDYKYAIKYYEMWLKAEPNNKDAQKGFDEAKRKLEESK